MSIYFFIYEDKTQNRNKELDDNIVFVIRYIMELSKRGVMDVSIFQKRWMRIVLGSIVGILILLWFVPINSVTLNAGCNSVTQYFNIYGMKRYRDIVFAECSMEGEPQSSVYNRVIWHEDMFGRFCGMVNGQEVIFRSYDELHTAVLEDGKNEYGFAHGFAGIYYWDEVEQRWLSPSETNERREAAKEMWRNAMD